MELEFRSVNKESWDDFENLFESKGGPHYCWCTVWRKIQKKGKQTTKAEKKDGIKNYVDSNIPVGILAYREKEAVAWCSIAPRDSYRTLGGYETDRAVWSIVCFILKDLSGIKEFKAN